MAEKGLIQWDEEAVREFVDAHFEILNEKGDELITMCPFCNGGDHEEISFNINPVAGAAQCWRANNCAWNGTIVMLIKDFLGCDWKTAFKIAGGEPPEDLDEVIGVLDRKLKNLKPEHFSFTKGHRGKIDVFPKDAIPLLDSERLDEVFEWLEYRRGYDPDEFVVDHDLFVVEDSEWFWGRVIFRIKTGDHDAYLAYAVDPTLEKKTINPPGEILSRMLYNYEEAKDGNIIFICEGIFDAARLIERGFFAMAVFGVNLSLEQVFLLAATDAEELVVCFDEGTDRWEGKQAEHKGPGDLPPAQKAATLLGKYVHDKTVSYISLDVPDTDPDNIDEGDFVRCFMNRRKLLRDDDLVDYLIKELE